MKIFQRFCTVIQGISMLVAIIAAVKGEVAMTIVFVGICLWFTQLERDNETAS